jgi:hypothetical protein
LWVKKANRYIDSWQEVKEVKQNVYVEFYGEQIDQAEVIAQAKKIWTDSGKKASDLKKLEIYIKPEDDRVYYVFNGIDSGSFPIINTQNDF